MVRQLTKDCYALLIADKPLRPAMIVDFGVDTPEHYQALQDAILAGATVEELDAALGKGKSQNALVAKYGVETNVVFKTDWDWTRENVQEQIKELEGKQILSEEERVLLNELYEEVKSL